MTADRPGVTGHLDVEAYITPAVIDVITWETAFSVPPDDGEVEQARTIARNVLSHPDVLAKHRQDVLREKRPEVNASELLDALLAASDDLHEAYRSKDPKRAEARGVAFNDLYQLAVDAITYGGVA